MCQTSGQLKTMPKPRQLLLDHLVVMICLVYVDSASQGLCTIESHSDYLTTICFGYLDSQRPFINWTLSVPGQADEEITCDTLSGRCNQSGCLRATVTAKDKLFISVATLQKLKGSQGQIKMTCLALGGAVDNLAPETILCHKFFCSEKKIELCSDMSFGAPGSTLVCDREREYCGIYEQTVKRTTSLNSARGLASDSGDTELVILRSVCKRRVKRNTFDSNIRKLTKGDEIYRRNTRSTETDNCMPELKISTSDKKYIHVYICHELTDRDLEIECKDKKTSSTLNLTCYFSGYNITNSSFQFDHKTNNYDKMSCHCFVEQTAECNQSQTFVSFAFTYRNQTCKNTEVESDIGFSQFYVFAGVLSVCCFIFVSATCAFIFKHGAGLYAYYYMDLYRKVKMELTHHNKPPLPPPRLPPRRLTTCSVNGQSNAPGVACAQSPESSYPNEEEVELFKNLQNSCSGQTGLQPASPPSNDGELLDDGYLVPKSLTMPCRGVNSLASNIQMSTTRRTLSLKSTYPRKTGSGLPPPLPCKRQDGNLVVSEFKCAIYESSNSTSSLSNSLDSDDSLSISLVDDYT